MTLNSFKEFGVVTTRELEWRVNPEKKLSILSTMSVYIMFGITPQLKLSKKHCLGWR